MLSMVKDLGSLKEAEKYNQRISDYRCYAITKGYSAGCIGSLACVHCYHVISDSICLCTGVFICPNCNKQNGQIIKPTDIYLSNNKIFLSDFRIGELTYINLITEDYSI